MVVLESYLRDYTAKQAVLFTKKKQQHHALEMKCTRHLKRLLTMSCLYTAQSCKNKQQYSLMLAEQKAGNKTCS